MSLIYSHLNKKLSTHVAHCQQLSKTPLKLREGERQVVTPPQRISAEERALGLQVQTLENRLNKLLQGMNGEIVEYVSPSWSFSPLLPTIFLCYSACLDFCAILLITSCVPTYCTYHLTLCCWTWFQYMLLQFPLQPCHFSRFLHHCISEVQHEQVGPKPV